MGKKFEAKKVTKDDKLKQLISKKPIEEKNLEIEINKSIDCEQKK